MLVSGGVGARSVPAGHDVSGQSDTCRASWEPLARPTLDALTAVERLDGSQERSWGLPSGDQAEALKSPPPGSRWALSAVGALT